MESPPATTAAAAATTAATAATVNAQFFGQYMAARVRVHRVPDDLVPCGGWDAHAKRFKRAANRRGAAVEIFNPDTKRSQAPVPTDDPFLHDIVRPCLQRVGALRGREIGMAFVLKSKPGCKQQEWHVDYSPADCAAVRRKPLGLLLAIQDGTQFKCILAGRVTTINLDAGDFVLFDGDLVHCGAAYTKTNYRLHAYVDVAGVEVSDTTWLVDAKQLIV